MKMSGNFRPAKRHFLGGAGFFLAAALLTFIAAPAAFAQGSSSVTKTVPSNREAAPPDTQTPAEPPAEAATDAPAGQQPEAAAQTPEGKQPDAAPADNAATDAGAQQQPDAQAATPAEGENNSGWSTNFGLTPPETTLFTGDPEQVAIVDKINAYFNDLTNLEGDFLQTDPDSKSKKGRFFIERPGKVRFDYARPSREKIISDGQYLAIENHDLKTTDRYPLGSTPFKLLLTEQVDLIRDAAIISIDQGENIVVITVEDKAGKGNGQIRLFFDWPEVQLREWIITDAQGLSTRIELVNVELNKETDPKLFTFSKDLGFPNFRSEN